MKLRDTLLNHGSIIVDVTTDEEIQDIDLAIKYNDHGDEFLYVRTYSGEQYEYGYYLNRFGYPDYSPENEKTNYDGRFIKSPVLFSKPDYNAVLSNEMFRLFHDDRDGLQTWMAFGPCRFSDARRRLTHVLSWADIIIKAHPGVRYDFENHRREALNFIVINELGDEFTEVMDSIQWTSRINGFDGIAGKKKQDNYLYGDRVLSVLYRGRNYDLTKLTYSVRSTDDWGFDTYRLNTKQFG